MHAISRRFVSFFVLVAASIAAFAAPGDPDPTFGTYGAQLIDFGGPAPVRIVASARQYSGKVVVVGQSPDPSTNRNRLAFGRLNIDGTPDVTFGSGGWALLGDNGDLVPMAMGLSDDDSLLVVGKRDGLYTFIARMDRDGVSSFGNQVTVDYNSMSLDETPRAAAWLGSYQLAVAGTCRQYPSGASLACVVMYDRFGNRGFGPVLLGGSSSSSDAFAVTPDASLSAFFVAGRADDGRGNRDFFIAKVGADMQVDPTFGSRTIDFGGQDEAYAVQMRGGGHVMVAGRSESGGVGQVAMASMSAFDGTLDITDNRFGIDGKILLPMQWQGSPADAGVSSLFFSTGAVLPDGIFALITVRPNANESHLVTARFDHSGALVWMNSLPGAAADLDSAVGVHDINIYRDSVIALGARNGVELVASKYDMYGGAGDGNYGSAGVLHLPAYFSTQDALNALAAHPAGGYVGAMSGNFGVFGLFRTTPDGRLDPSFGTNGVVSLEAGGYEIAVQSDGKIVTAHEAHAVPGDPYSRVVIAVERFDASGNRDGGFGGGRVMVDFGGSSTPGAVVVQPDGRILVAGSVSLSNPNRIRMAIARLNPNGSFDPAFMGGMAIVAPGLPGEEETRSVALLADGRIVLGGRGGGDTGAYTWTVYRLLSNGGQDMSWAGGGAAVSTSCAPVTNSKLAAGPADTIVVGGAMQRTSDTDTCFARFLANGTPDPSFGGIGLVLPNMGMSYDSAGGVAVDAYGRIVSTVNGYGAPTLIRLNADGSFDFTFGGTGAVGYGTPGSVHISGVIRQPDEKLLAWGNGNLFSDGDALLLRYEGGGLPPSDTTPDPFTFIDVTNVFAGATMTSNAVTITGINAQAPISVSGGLYSIGCNGTFTTSPQTINNGQTVCVRHSSATTASTATDTTLTVGGVSDTFTSRTGDTDTLLTGTPTNPSGANNAFRFTYSGMAAAFRYECSLDAAPWAVCTSPTAVFPGNGAHTFQVRAFSAYGVDPTPASYTWVVDIVAPDTTITSSPPALTTSPTATFAFTSNDAGAGFQCSLDNATFSICTSPITYAIAIEGGHLFQVRAVDSVGNVDPTPAKVIWTLDTQPPETTITSGPPQYSSSSGAVFSFTSSDPNATTECRIDNLAFTPCVSPATYAGLVDGNHSFFVRAIDAAGNIDPTPAQAFWTVDTVAPDTTITAAPSGTVASTSASFSFTANEAFSTLECSLDGVAFASCASPVSYSALSQGAHTFAVRAIDRAGNVDASPATASWTVDAVAPETTIVSGPAAVTSSTSATFTVSTDEAATLQCSLDGAAFSACASPVPYAGLAQGTHTFRVRATDAVGNVDATPAQQSWVVDATAPDSTITSSPSALTSSQNASFTFASDDPAAAFECSLDGGAFAACTSPRTYGGLADGLHAFAVRAIDAAGNVDATPAQAQWTIDTAAPDTLITSGPNPVTSATTATFTFQSTEAGATFECALDGGGFAACPSPAAYAGLAEGAHQLRVRAVDPALNVDASPSLFAWTIDLTSPDTTITSSPPLATAQTTAAFAFTSNEAPVTFECRLDGGTFAACASPAAYAGLAEGFHTFDVRALDLAGNVDTQPATWTWKVDTTPPDTLLAFTPAASPSNATSFTATMGSEIGATYECRLDGGAWAPCTSPFTQSGLADGTHTFEARATDAAGNVDQTPATRTWVIDTVAPDTAIASGPSGTVASNSALFSFTSTESPGFFECSLDGAAFAACGPGASYSNLAEGSHTLQVRAKDQAGNVDATPALRSWIVDTVAPDTTLTSGPSGSVASTSASFSFTSEAGAAFECRLDGAAFAACSSPVSLGGLTQGAHTFDVRAKDAVGNMDPTPASRTWTVDTIAPDTTITGGPSGNNNPDTATFTFTSTEAGTFECKLDTGAFATCVSGITYTGLVKGEHTFQVRAIDAAGNVDATPASRTWRSK